MEEKTQPEAAPDIKELQKKLEHWRKNKKENNQPIPRNLWERAIELARKYAVSPVARALRLSYTNLKEKTYPKKEKKIPFIEFNPSQPMMPETMVEIENAKGSKLRIHFKGGTKFDLAEIAKEFMGSL
jgi:hypothetical protein